IRDRIADLLDTSYPTELLDVVVAVDRPVSALGEELLAMGRVTSVPADVPGGKAAALNAAMRAATGEVVVFADTHQRFERETIPRLVSTFREPRVGAVSGSLRLPADSRT